jgi:hypothetical protein
MSKVVHLPTSINDPTRPLIQQSEAQEIGISRAQIARAAHDLKNRMSVLLLAISSLKDNGNQPAMPMGRRLALENLVAEMNHLVDEMVGLVERSDKTI